MSTKSGLAVETYTFTPGRAPVVFQAMEPGTPLIDWAVSNLDVLRKTLCKAGGLLFRGFDLGSPRNFETLIQKTAGPPIQYSYASTPRTRVMANIYTSTEYPAHRAIPLHNEMAYTGSWPSTLFFFCHTPSSAGGQTPIADSRRIYKSLSRETRDAFATRGLCYVRNYDGRMDLSWQKAFSTHSAEEVAQRCKAMNIDFEWISEDHLRTREICQGVVDHPQTGETVWFNQAHLFHVSALEPDIRELLLSNGEENLPRNVYFGDGSPIPEVMLNEVRQVLDREMTVFDWAKGDVMMLDNLLSAHGRKPYEGRRKILVGMTA